MIIKLNDLNMPQVQLYASQNEIPLKRFYEPLPGLFIAETANVILQALKAGYEPISMLLEERYVVDPGVYNDDLPGNPKRLVEGILSIVGDIPVYVAGLDVISKINGFKQTRGILCAMRRKVLPELSEVISGKSRIAILEDVENPTNVGAIFRSAAALGFEAIVLTHGCSDPLYRRSARVSMGSVFSIPWTFVGGKNTPWQHPNIETIKNQGFKIVSMALHDNSVFLGRDGLSSEEKLAVVFGNEENGITDVTLELSDSIVKIPMLHGVDSLNVAAASAVAFWELRKH